MLYAISFTELLGPNDGKQSDISPGTYKSFLHSAARLIHAAQEEESTARKYIASLIQGMTGMRPLMAAEEGETAANQFYSLCSKVIEHGYMDATDSRVKRILTLQNKLPPDLPMQAQTAACFLELTAFYELIEASRFAHKLYEQFYITIPQYELEDMAAKIHSVTGVTPIKKFHRAFISLFLTPCPLALFRAGFSQAISDILSDPNSGSIAFAAHMEAYRALKLNPKANQK